MRGKEWSRATDLEVHGRGGVVKGNRSRGAWEGRIVKDNRSRGAWEGRMVKDNRSRGA